MREFFQGWRRKVGCVTLVLALLAACGWVRSSRMGDIVTLSMGKIALGVHSRSGMITVLVYRIFGHGLNGMFAGERSEWTSFEVVANKYDSPAGEGGELILDECDHKATFCAVVLASQSTYAVIGDNEAETRLEVNSLATPYGYIAMPLTLLSAYLLLRFSIPLSHRFCLPACSSGSVDHDGRR